MMMMLGRNLQLPIDLFVGRPMEEGLSNKHTNYAIRIHKFAQKHLQLKSEKMTEHYDSRVAGSELENGTQYSSITLSLRTVIKKLLTRSIRYNSVLDESQSDPPTWY